MAAILAAGILMLQSAGTLFAAEKALQIQIQGCWT